MLGTIIGVAISLLVFALLLAFRKPRVETPKPEKKISECCYCRGYLSYESCMEEVGFAICTRKKGHTGPHVACAPIFGIHLIAKSHYHPNKEES